jgi:hypothetical protein
LYFAAATQFEDTYEGAIRVVPAGLAGLPVGSKAAAFNAFLGNVRNHYKVSCWHRAAIENALMWQAYASKGRGAAICTTLERFVHAVKPFRLGHESPNVVFWCGKVKYLDLTKERVPSNATPPVGMVKRFFFKHNAFEPEKEFRFLADLHYPSRALTDPAPPTHGILVDVDLAVLVQAVVIGPSLPDGDAAKVAEAAALAGLADRVRESGLRQKPRFF